jgi:hypothetical protein
VETKDRAQKSHLLKIDISLLYEGELAQRQAGGPGKLSQFVVEQRRV